MILGFISKKKNVIKMNDQQLLASCTLSVPSKLIFGIDTVTEIPAEVKRLSSKSAVVFFLTDENIKKTVAVKKIEKKLKQEEVKSKIFAMKSGEPSLEVANDIANRIREDDFDLVIGVGGGSTMDMAKTAAIMYTNPGNVENYFSFEQSPIKKSPLPKILIPSTAGTGSEVTPYAMVTHEGIKYAITGPEVVADVAIVDPRVTVSCPPKVTAYTGMDALTHNLEAVLSLKASPLTDMYAFEAIRLIGRSMRTAYFSGANLKARYNMSLAATLGGLAISPPSVPINIGHALSEYFGPKYGIPHGIANAIQAPFMMEFNLPAAIDRLNIIASCFGVDTTKMAPREGAIEAIKAVRMLVGDLELPSSLKEVNIPKDDIEDIAKYMFQKQQYEYGLPERNPRIITMENIKSLIENIWEGKLKTIKLN